MKLPPDNEGPPPGIHRIWKQLDCKIHLIDTGHCTVTKRISQLTHFKPASRVSLNIGSSWWWEKPNQIRWNIIMSVFCCSEGSLITWRKRTCTLHGLHWDKKRSHRFYINFLSVSSTDISTGRAGKLLIYFNTLVRVCCLKTLYWESLMGSFLVANSNSSNYSSLSLSHSVSNTLWHHFHFVSEIFSIYTYLNGWI